MKYVKLKCNCEKKFISKNKPTRMKNGSTYLCKDCNQKIKFHKKENKVSINKRIEKLEARRKELKNEIKELKKSL
jgi:hypothetical protein